MLSYIFTVDFEAMEVVRSIKFRKLAVKLESIVGMVNGISSVSAMLMIFLIFRFFLCINSDNIQTNARHQTLQYNFVSTNDQSIYE